MLSIRDLSMQLGKTFRIEGVSLDVDRGERVSVLGPNGSGKSSLLRAIAGLETLRSGTISWSGTVLSNGSRILVPPEDRGMGILLQESALFPHLDARANVALALPTGTDRSERCERVDRALELARASHLGSGSVVVLSGGEQQRVALARALVRHPQLLLLDEPFHSLDGPIKNEILVELRDIVKDEGMAAIHVTHDAPEAAAFSDRVVLLRNGRKVQEGPFEEIYAHPVDSFAASFLGPVETVEAERARRDGIGLPEGCGDGILSFRPEHLVLEPIRDGEPSGSRLVVRRVRVTGALREVTVASADGSTLTSRCPESSSVGIGREVTARIVRTLTWGDESREARGGRTQREAEEAK